MAVVLSDEEKRILTTMVEMDRKTPIGADRSFYLIPRTSTDPLPTLAHSVTQWQEAVNEGVLIALAEERFVRRVKPDAGLPWYEVTEAGRRHVQELQKGSPEKERILELLKASDAILRYPMNHEANWLRIKIERDYWYSDMVAFIDDTYGKNVLSSFRHALPSMNVNDSAYTKAERSHMQIEAGKIFLETLKGRPVQRNQAQQSTHTTGREKPEKVFVVHGHDEGGKHHAARFIEKLGIQAIVLEERPDAGRTIIEKFEQESEHVGFALILLTPDDLATDPAIPDRTAERARQNVIFELGYFVGKLGRGRVCLLRKGKVEMPSDLQGVIYKPMNENNDWYLAVAKDLNRARFPVDLNKLLS